jgi:hypothetical protein
MRTSSSLPFTGHGGSGHLCDLFTSSVEESDPLRGANADPAVQASAGHLWGCTDILPRHVCDILDVPQGSTYAQAARAVRRAARG